jgi:hypothetical protein
LLRDPVEGDKFGPRFNQMSTKIGRNDPCPCGSGKKYKRCHLPLDQQRKPAVAEEREEPASLSPTAPVKYTASYLRDLVSKLPKDVFAEKTDLLAQTLEIADYMERQEEIQAAGATLEQRRQEFAKLMEDEQAVLNQSRALFADERFAPLWFTAADIRRAFEHIGGAPDLSAHDETVEALRTAILFLADKDRRTRLSMGLLKWLAEFVKAERFMDAWLIQHNALLTAESDGETNFFLFEMFLHGYEAWTAEERERGAAVIKALGMEPDRLQKMKPEEIVAWMEEMQADPAKTAQAEAFLKAHPEYATTAAANRDELERKFSNLLKRPSSRAILLPPEEIQPWLPRLMETWQKALLDPEFESGSVNEERTKKIVQKVVFPLFREMTQGIFTPERIGQLVLQLGKYQKELSAVGDPLAAGCVLAVCGCVRKETEPGRNFFLISLCSESVGAVLEHMRKENPTENEEESAKL